MSGSVAVESTCGGVSLTLLVIACYPLTNFQNDIERLESSTGGTFELTDGFVEIHLTFQLVPARIFECHLTIQHQIGRRVSTVVFPHFAFVLLFAGAAGFGRRPQTGLCCAH